MPTGSVTRKHFALGYQEAMNDVIESYEAGGVNAILEWVEMNTRDAAMRERLDLAVEAVNTARFGPR